MIKRFRFVKRRAGMSVEAFAASWPRAVRSEAMRAVVCTTLYEVEAAPHDGVSIEWFADLTALRPHHDDDVSLTDAVVIAEERVMRGADWLTQRWTQGDKLKHMALARRAEELSAAAFSERWRNHAGSVGSTPIPDAAKGLAYVQNYPPAGIEQDARYDAINEVYFDDLAALRARVAFFRAQNAPRAASDLVSEATFIAVRECVVS